MDQRTAEEVVAQLRRVQFLDIADTILRKLTPLFELNRRSYSEATLIEHCVDPGVTARYMGMGTRQTWHGTPDGRANFAAVSIARTSDHGNTSESESEHSSVSKTVYEAKKEFCGANIDQLTAQAVVSSFVHNKRHPDQNPLVPAVGISTLDGYMVSIMYDCKLDVLLTSSLIKWLDIDDKRLVKSGVVLLWLVLHHRLFLRELECKVELSEAGLKKIFRNAQALQAYEQLDSFSVYTWPRVDWKRRLPEVVPEVSLDLPPKSNWRAGASQPSRSTGTKFLCGSKPT